MTLFQKNNKQESVDHSDLNSLFGAQDPNGETITYYYIPNRDGSPRWLFPSNLDKPSFLRFYNSQGTWGNVYFIFFTLLFRFKLQTLICPKLEIQAKEAPKYFQTLTEHGAFSHSIFTGTVGPNRAALVEFYDKEGKGHFIKIPLTRKSISQVKHECKMLSKVHAADLKKTKAPLCSKAGYDNAIILTDVSQGGNRYSTIQEQHIHSLNEMHQLSNSKGALREYSFWLNIKERIARLRNSEINSKFTKLFELGNTLFLNYHDNDELVCCFAHGDFTPWNMFVGESDLSLYDFEMAAYEMPFGYDLFHFIFQAGILQKGKGYQEILKEIEAAIKLWTEKNGKHSFPKNWQKYLDLYLLDVSTYYTELYNQQTELHTQVDWLTDVWMTAINNRLETNKDQRQQEIDSIFSFLSSKEYALLKFSERSLDKLDANSDLDILTRKETAKELIKRLKKSDRIVKLRSKHFSFMSILECYFKDGGFLEIDLIYKIKVKDKQLLKAEDILQNTEQLEDGIKVPSLYHDFAYTSSFYQLNNSAVPQKYLDFFDDQEKNNTTKLHQLFSENFDCPIEKLGQLGTSNIEVQQAIQRNLKQKPFNSGWKGLVNRVQYGFDSISRLFWNKGLVITFSGVDGAGKSTMIDIIKSEIEDKYRKQTVVLRHRPSLLPILSAFKHGKQKAEKIAAEKLPHSGKNSSALSSYIRFFYYYVDYLLGQWYVKIKHIWRGHIVLYDRYYFDFIEDAKRSNIEIDKRLARFLFRFVYKPHINIFLYASPEEILRRKEELSKERIESMTKGYKSMFDELDQKQNRKRYICIENIDKEETKEIVLDAFKTAV